MLYRGHMLGEVIEAAARLAMEDDATVGAALRHYQRVAPPPVTKQAEVWVSVAFMMKRHEVTAATLPW